MKMPFFTFLQTGHAVTFNIRYMNRTACLFTHAWIHTTDHEAKRLVFTNTQFAYTELRFVNINVCKQAIWFMCLMPNVVMYISDSGAVEKRHFYVT